MRRFVLLLLVASALVGCSDDDEFACDVGFFFDITVSLEGFDEHVGQRFESRTVSFGDTLDDVVVPAIPAADFSVTLSAICGTNNIEFYADVNGNEAYDPPPTDHAWRITVGAPDGLVEPVVFQHDTNHVDIGWE